MKKRYLYNGKRTGAGKCANPNALKFGREYEVYEVIQNEETGEEKYRIKGVGVFPKDWFDEVEYPCYKAIMTCVPKIGEKICNFWRQEEHSVFVWHEDIETVKMVINLRDNFYIVVTEYPVFIIEVKK